MVFWVKRQRVRYVINFLWASISLSFWTHGDRRRVASLRKSAPQLNRVVIGDLCPTCQKLRLSLTEYSTFNIWYEWHGRPVTDICAKSHFITCARYRTNIWGDDRARQAHHLIGNYISHPNRARNNVRLPFGKLSNEWFATVFFAFLFLFKVCWFQTRVFLQNRTASQKHESSLLVADKHHAQQKLTGCS